MLKSYRNLILISHPDKSSQNEIQNQKFREIKTAYDILINDETRRIYDLGLNVKHFLFFWFLIITIFFIFI